MKIPAPADFAERMIETRENGRRGELEKPPWMSALYAQITKIELENKALTLENEQLKARLWELEHRG